MNTALLAAQSLLAIVFMFSGVNKSIYSEKQLVAKGQTGVANLPQPLIRFIGISEILGAMGIILPQALNILPVLTVISAIGFATIMVLAGIIHSKLHEPKNVATNALLFALSIFVVLGRI